MQSGENSSQVMIKRLSEPYDECVDTSSGKHDFTRNVYEEKYPETLYSLEVQLQLCYLSLLLLLQNIYNLWSYSVFLSSKVLGYDSQP